MASREEARRFVWNSQKDNTAPDDPERLMLFAGTTKCSVLQHPGADRRASLTLSFQPKTTFMRQEELRQSDRVSLRIPVEVTWFTQQGIPGTEIAHTVLVGRNGGVLRMTSKLPAGQDMTLTRQRDGEDWKVTRARVVAEIDLDPPGFLYAIAILDPKGDFWDIDFPPAYRAEDALARMLMECSFCKRREVVYLDELQVKSFEVRKCIARICPQCETPSIWGQVQPEAKAEPPVITPEDRVPPRRKRPRVKARVLACIRRKGFQEEIAVCEDLSKGGISFRSRNQYPVGTRLEVAVPFTPGGPAIFVAIRVVSSNAIPSAGLYRHGAAYITVPVPATV
jgi:PilZ domain